MDNMSLALAQIYIELYSSKNISLNKSNDRSKSNPNLNFLEVSNQILENINS